MSIVNFQNVAPILAACVTTGGIVFQIGKQSERMDSIGLKVEAQEKKIITSNEGIANVNSKLNIISNDLSHVKRDIHDIKTKMKIM
tara:strand:+ start:15293 stop:15550 length:258 start_codon:yes stop_codon:yes gene_type:complete